LFVNNLFYTIINIERVGDHAENFADLAIEKFRKNIFLMEYAYNELKEISCKAIDCSSDNG